MQALKSGSDVLFVLLGAILVLAMHSGFAFLELGTVRSKNQVNALVKILADFCVSTVAYFVVGFGVAYGVSFFTGADHLAQSRRFCVAAQLPFRSARWESVGARGHLAEDRFRCALLFQLPRALGQGAG